jgi:uncharacterized protein (TIGR00725 family)
MSKQYQIGVMGSAADLGYSAEVEAAAIEIGREVARRNAILVFGAEKDSDSLSTSAFRGARDAGGITVGITYGKGQNIWGKEKPTVIIPTGLERGGGRELTLVLSCDAIIAISGGSGTLTEMVIAYQAGIPIVALNGFGGWADRLSDSFIDTRNRLKVIAARTPAESVDVAIKLIKKENSQIG